MVIKVTNKNLAEVRLDSLISIIRKRSVVNNPETLVIAFIEIRTENIRKVYFLLIKMNNVTVNLVVRELSQILIVVTVNMHSPSAEIIRESL